LQCSIDPESRAADEFGLSNGSEYIACGILGGITGNRAHGIVIDDPEVVSKSWPEWWDVRSSLLVVAAK
jgi:hypothetical protein